MAENPFITKAKRNPFIDKAKGTDNERKARQKRRAEINYKALRAILESFGPKDSKNAKERVRKRVIEARTAVKAYE